MWSRRKERIGWKTDTKCFRPLLTARVLNLTMEFQSFFSENLGLLSIFRNPELVLFQQSDLFWSNLSCVTEKYKFRGNSPWRKLSIYWCLVQKSSSLFKNQIFWSELFRKIFRTDWRVWRKNLKTDFPEHGIYYLIFGLKIQFVKMN